MVRCEIPYNDDVVSVSMAGYIIRDAVKYSRRRCKGTGGYLQLCDAIEVDINDSSIITRIRGKPLELDKQYIVATALITLQGSSSSSSHKAQSCDYHHHYAAVVAVLYNIIIIKLIMIMMMQVLIIMRS